ncbi:MAG TPA: SUMF1/EgtB/PvdO family nonheme iron enzyme [Phycisphaerales bacterium]|nr:SUMF1/EgtB/PvdO family nonheme iron enzyme [Phycisphaerales bacterium]
MRTRHHKSRSPRSRLLTACSLLASLGCLWTAPNAAHAGLSNDGLDWVAIGSPGNRGILPEETDLYRGPLGAVDYDYRMTRTEITYSQWFEFVQAYAPYYEGSHGDSTFLGRFIIYSISTQSYELQRGAENYPIEVGWRFAARYCNWLHNDKALTENAFQAGAYDTSTFGDNPDGTFTDQLTHSPNARYWIPTDNEWLKAAYYDPNRYGENQEGYWLYPYASNEPPIPGNPADGATTNAGPGGSFANRNAGSYPWANAPWGLLDVSGGAEEWLEDATSGLNGPLARGWRGSGWGDDGYQTYDRNDWSFLTRVGSQIGLRVASVPTPGSLLVIWIMAPWALRRRNQQ